MIVSYNSRVYLEKCLTAVLKTVGTDCEIVLVDNASVDGSAAFVAQAFPGVRLVCNSLNTGFAAANNQAVVLAQGRYLVALNPDTVVTPGWLEALLAPLENRPEAYAQGEVGVIEPKPVSRAALPVGLTTARILVMAGQDTDQAHLATALINTCGNNAHYTGLTVCRGLGLAADAPQMSTTSPVSAVSGACFALRRDLWQSLGGLDETFFTYLEDTDLSLRASLAGYSCLYVPQAVVYHDYDPGRFSARKLYHLERNRLLMLLKIYRWPTLAWLLPALGLTELVTWGYALKSGPAVIGAKLRAYGWLWRHRAEVLQKRRRVQALRRVDDKTLLNGLCWQLDLYQLGGKRLGRIADYTLNPFFKLYGSLVKPWLSGWPKS